LNWTLSKCGNLHKLVTERTESKIECGSSELEMADCQSLLGELRLQQWIPRKQVSTMLNCVNESINSLKMGSIRVSLVNAGICKPGKIWRRHT
jgi:hypothetical protein